MTVDIELAIIPIILIIMCCGFSYWWCTAESHNERLTNIVPPVINEAAEQTLDISDGFGYLKWIIFIFLLIYNDFSKFFFHIVFSDYFMEQLRWTRTDLALLLPVLTV